MQPGQPFLLFPDDVQLEVAPLPVSVPGQSVRIANLYGLVERLRALENLCFYYSVNSDAFLTAKLDGHRGAERVFEIKVLVVGLYKLVF